MEALKGYIASQIRKSIRRTSQGNSYDIYLYVSHKGFSFNTYRVDIEVIERGSVIWMASPEIPPCLPKRKSLPPRIIAHASLGFPMVNNPWGYYDDLIGATSPSRLADGAKDAF